jgi:hypothetical protein
MAKLEQHSHGMYIIINYVQSSQRPPKISSRMKSVQRVGMKVAGDGCRTEFARMKVAGVMVAEVKVAAVLVEWAAVMSGTAVGAWVAA